MALYDLTNVTAANNLIELFIAHNQLSLNVLAYFILLGVFIITFAITVQNDKKTSLVIASFLTLIVSILMFFMGFFALSVVSIPVILLIVGLGAFMFSND